MTWNLPEVLRSLAENQKVGYLGKWYCEAFNAPFEGSIRIHPNLWLDAGEPQEQGQHLLCVLCTESFPNRPAVLGKDQAGLGSVLEFVCPASLINKTSVIIFQHDLTIGCASCYFHQPWGYPDVSWEINSISGLKPAVGPCFYSCTHKVLKAHGPLAQACRFLVSGMWCPVRPWCPQDLVNVLAFQKKDRLEGIVGREAWQGSLHHQHGFNLTLNMQGKISWPPLLPCCSVHEVTLPLQRLLLPQ